PDLRLVTLSIDLLDVDAMLAERDRVASPALEVSATRLAVRRIERDRPDVLRVVRDTGGLPGDEVEVVGQRRAEHRGEEVVADRVLPRPVPVGGDLRAEELRVGPRVAVEVDAEVVELPVVVLRARRATVVTRLFGA